MTSTGTVMGTPHYMSPEQVKGLKADARSDVFALGCVFYELLSGRKPFDAESMHGVLFKVMQDDPAPLAEVAPEVPHALVQVVERALAKDPAERFQSAGELLAGLRLARAAGTARPPERAEPARAAGWHRPRHAGSGARGLAHWHPSGHAPAREEQRGAPGRRSDASPLVIGVVVGLLVVGVAAWAARALVDRAAGTLAAAAGRAPARRRDRDARPARAAPPRLRRLHGSRARRRERAQARPGERRRQSRARGGPRAGEARRGRGRRAARGRRRGAATWPPPRSS